MSNIFFKRAFLAGVSILLSATMILTAQTKTEYFMRTSYMRTYLNPALTPEQGQLVVPVLPNIGAGVQTNTINLDHLTFSKNGERVTFLHPLVSDGEFLDGIKKNNYINTNVNYKIFALGLYLGDRYTNFDIGFRTSVDVNLPKSVFELLKVGFDQDNDLAYNLSDLSANALSFVEIGAAQSRNFLDKTLVVGARVKLLLGGGYFDLDAKSLEIEADQKRWRALSHVTLKGAAPGAKAKYDDEGMINGFDFSWEGIPGYGVGLDIGAVYDMRKAVPVLNGLTVSAALNDIGFIHWNKKNSLSLSSSGDPVIVEPTAIYDKEENNSLSDVLENAFDDLKQAVNLKEELSGSKARSTSLRVNMNLGAEYEFIKNKLSAGALYSARFGNYSTWHEFTVSGNYRPYYWLGASLSYSAVHSAFDTFGFALHLAPQKGITFFVASDYAMPHVSTQFVPTSSKGVNLQMGFSIPIGKPAREI